MTTFSSPRMMHPCGSNQGVTKKERHTVKIPLQQQHAFEFTHFGHQSNDVLSSLDKTQVTINVKDNNSSSMQSL